MADDTAKAAPQNGDTKSETAAQSRQSRIILLGILGAIALGILVGLGAPDLAKQVEFLGTLFLNGLKMLIVPLVVSSMIMGIASLGDVRKIGKLGGITVGYYLMTTFIAVVLGIILVTILQPGHAGSDKEAGTQTHEAITEFRNALVAYHGETGTLAPATDDGSTTAAVAAIQSANVAGNLGNYLRDGQVIDGWDGPLHFRYHPGALKLKEGAELRTSHFEVWVTPPEGVSALSRDLTEDKEAAMQSQGAYLTTEDQGVFEAAWFFIRDLLVRMVPTNVVHSAATMDILPLIVFSLAFGAVLTIVGSKGKPVLAFFDGVFVATMKFVHLLMWFAPIGIFALVAGRIASSPDIFKDLERLAAYVATVILALLIHAVVILPLFLFFVARRNPLNYAIGMGKALLTAFSTASSSATLPLTMEAVVEENKVSRRVTEFVLPLGATINMDGTALYEAVAAIFIAQLLVATGQMDPLTAGQIGIIFVTATLAAIGAAGIPEAGLVTMAIVFTAVGLPLEAIGTILVIDWFLDRCRTTVNVWGDAVGAAVVQKVAGITDEDSAAKAVEASGVAADGGVKTAPAPA